MPLEGEYAPSPWDWSREQAEKYAESGGTDAADMKGMPIILLTTVGAKTGKLRKTPLMRVEHDGQYAIVASLGGAPKNPVWYYNVAKNPRVELQDGRSPATTTPARYSATRRPSGGSARWRPSRTTPSTRRRPIGRFRSSCSPLCTELAAGWHH